MVGLEEGDIRQGELLMAASNRPEKSYFDRIVALEGEIAELQIDKKAVYEEAKALGKGGVNVLRAAVRRHLMDAKKRQLESDADDLLHRLGHLAYLPLGKAALKASE
jgi:uncharacterized protein (UPF0335 family)